MNKLLAAVSVVFILMSSCTIGQTTNDIEIDEFKKKMASEKYVLVDVRTAEEFADGYIEGALNIDYFSATFSEDISKLGLETPVLVYCRSGNRSRKSMKIMYDMGFNEVKNLDRINSSTKRQEGSIGFAVTRGGEIAGEHTVSFIGTNDRIDLVHKAQNRSIFVKGAIESAIFISDKDHGLYSIENIINLK